MVLGFCSGTLIDYIYIAHCRRFVYLISNALFVARYAVFLHGSICIGIKGSGKNCPPFTAASMNCTKGWSWAKDQQPSGGSWSCGTLMVYVLDGKGMMQPLLWSFKWINDELQSKLFIYIYINVSDTEQQKQKTIPECPENLRSEQSQWGLGTVCPLLDKYRVPVPVPRTNTDLSICYI